MTNESRTITTTNTVTSGFLLALMVRIYKLMYTEGFKNSPPFSNSFSTFPILGKLHISKKELSQAKNQGIIQEEGAVHPILSNRIRGPLLTIQVTHRIENLFTKQYLSTEYLKCTKYH